jgi:UDP-N-acetylmuramate dehydrogenase
MKILKNKNLKKLNTFGVSATAKYFAVAQNTNELKQILNSKEFKSCKKHLVLGGGSNILFVNNFDGLVIKNKIKGIKKIKETKNYTYLQFGAGEIWDDCVKYAVNKGLCGIENLALIPGTIGAAPIQNIGAYGAEIKNVFSTLQAIEIKTGKTKNFTKKDCEFDYRWSVFKGKLIDKFIVTNVTLKLSKNPKYNIKYAGLEQELQEKTINLKNIRKAVIKIRKSKLADPKILGNAGSFFKNPIVSKAKYKELKNVYKEIPGFEENSNIKLSAGWLIDNCGFKGYKYKNVGVFKNHALVLVNYKGTGKQLFELKEIIKKEVLKKYVVTLKEEVKIIL